jgi:thiamine pyrophosphate-dependent acetolactate synthase large subunit-like protein
LHHADVVLAVGNSLSPHATFGLRDDRFDGKTLIQVSIAPGEIDKFYPAQHALVSDARLAVEAVMTALEAKVGAVAAARVASQDYEFRKLLPRCTPEDEEIMAKGDWSDEANQLIRDRITGLLMTPPPKPPPLPKWLPSPPGPGVAPTEPSPLASVAARHPAVSTAATA